MLSAGSGVSCREADIGISPYHKIPLLSAGQGAPPHPGCGRAAEGSAVITDHTLKILNFTAAYAISALQGRSGPQTVQNLPRTTDPSMPLSETMKRRVVPSAPT